MLEIKKITKLYETEGFKQKALNEVSVNFRKCEFASILGPSGSGKTTFLNIIGGLDQYTSGDLIINSISTKKYKDSDWDSYRNHRIGFVFQNYNLISHQSILNNVKLALTLSGISKKEATNKAKKVLKDVGLEKHINKRPNQLSGGQMQRVAIARALINDPDILLADEPTGALDSETSVQIMKLLKDISKNKLVIMVTHNSELTNKYSNRIITLKDGKITSDSNPYDLKDDKNNKEINNNKTKKTTMSFKTALSLSFNNLMTKKGRTILVSFAGSIGIIGIALILAVSTGFKRYVDSIQKSALTSYPLTIMQNSADITSLLLSMTSLKGENDNTNVVKEQQYITTMLSNISTNDLKSFKKYYEDNIDKLSNDIASVKYSYSVDPMIYTKDINGKLQKLNPNNLFSSIYGSSSNMMNSFSTMTSVFSQMSDNINMLEEQYNVLAGSWPTKYNEMIIVLSEPNNISDLLVYSLGLRDSTELTEIIKSAMIGEKIDINNEPLSFTYEELMNINMKLIMPYDTYKYNSKYRVYEDMSKDENYMNELYNKSLELKIVGIVCPKESTNMALNPGISYSSKLIDFIIDNSQNSDIVKKQMENDEVDVFSGIRFDSKENNYDFEFADLVRVDNEKLQSAFNINIDKSSIEKETKKYMEDIVNAITVDYNNELSSFNSNLFVLSNGIFDDINDEFSLNDIEIIVNNYLDKNNSMFSEMEKKYVVPADTFKTTYSGLLKSLLDLYIRTYYNNDPSLTVDPNNMVAIKDNDLKDMIIISFTSSTPVKVSSETMAKVMAEARIKKEVISSVSNITNSLTKSFSNAFNVDESKIASAFELNFSEDELMRVVNSMMNDNEETVKTNLIALGYQDKDEPTYISYYFNSFDGKENFLKFIDEYNNKMKSINDEDKVINYTDATGVLISSVKTIVNAVSYVLIAFVSISLVVSSIMIGIITYISVYERTKEIGILRSIGASKRNISSIFNAETFIIGLFSGIIGITISYIFIPIINAIIHHFTGNIPLSATLQINNAVILIILSIILTLIGGLLPASAASKKNPVEALRNE